MEIFERNESEDEYLHLKFEINKKLLNILDLKGPTPKGKILRSFLDINPGYVLRALEELISLDLIEKINLPASKAKNYSSKKEPVYRIKNV